MSEGGRRGRGEASFLPPGREGPDVSERGRPTEEEEEKKGRRDRERNVETEADVSENVRKRK